MPRIEVSEDPLYRGGEVSPGLPSHLYHYTSPKGLRGIVEDRALYASSAHHMSDAAELRYAIRKVRPLLEELENEVRAGEREFDDEIALVDRMGDALQQLKESEVFVCSFSVRGNLLSQWRAYCPDQGGYSVGFGAKALAVLARLQGFDLVECLYSEDEYRPELENIVYEARKYYRVSRREGREPTEKLVNDHVAAFKGFFAKLAARIKHPAFRQEEEWRLVSAPLAVETTETRFREGNSTLVPYIDFALEIENETLFEDIDHRPSEVNSPITKVLVGPTPHPNLARQSVRALLRTEEVWGAVVELSKIPYRTW